MCCYLPLAVDGGWSAWAEWGACPVTCGTGTQLRSHTCTNPPPSDGGAGCTGGETDSQPCATDPCPGMCPFKGMYLCFPVFQTNMFSYCV